MDNILLPICACIKRVSYILKRAVTDTEKQVWVKYWVLGPSKTPSENTHISVKTIHRHKCTEYFSTEQPNAPG